MRDIVMNIAPDNTNDRTLYRIIYESDLKATCIIVCFSPSRKTLVSGEKLAGEG